ncbi:YjgN family protein [Neisseria sp.]|uniref:YjgN family protein n=1 Tax=Neisseria sp. TaxID=192066 RepID=UPI00359FFE9F
MSDASQSATQNSMAVSPETAQTEIQPLPASPAPQTDKTPFRQWRFDFHGNAGEYFKIWIVNLFLTIITLGIYSPWAKVRRMRYFYGNTQLGNDRFDFTALPSRILLGRIIAVVLFTATSVLSNIDPLWALVMWGVIFLVMPWLVRSSLRFRARNSKYGNSRFYFSASTGRTYWLFIKCLLVTVVSFGLLYPVALYWFKSYQIDNLHIGNLKFKMNSSIGSFYAAVLLPYGVFLAISFVVSIIFLLIAGIVGISSPNTFDPSTLTGLMIVVFYAFMLGFFVPLTQGYLFCTTWHDVYTGRSRVYTRMSPFSYAWVKFTNYLVIVPTLGLMHPWAAVRFYRAVAESMYVDLSDDPENLMNLAQNDPHSIGEEIADIFDLDLSL